MRGDLEATAAARLDEEFYVHLERRAPVPRLVVDLCDTGLVSARGVHTLIGAAERCADQGTRMEVLVSTGTVAARVLRAAGTGTRLRVTES
ncbi:hypothetical protein BJP25_18450 [Actinokineospora bangkokensis]|uniref:STAS domain-containing protein n=1 Tax=Actinokineospora bangkokensis TaxID=1193682 RepID=A0A1Q9LLQ5_9PSEU|nr:hypothetical protein [Actinokineospora bangkokensis]OLR92951.1 hypothetical protein BJP25_18450 [Actinokineospora bangkokensis]